LTNGFSRRLVRVLFLLAAILPCFLLPGRTESRPGENPHAHFRNPEFCAQCHLQNGGKPDPDRFLPSPGRLTAFRPPGGPGVRVDTAGFVGATVPPNYDSLLAKVITAGADRAEAIARMLRALAEFEVAGVSTTIPFHQKVLQHPDFVAGRLSTRFLERLAAAPEP